MCSSSKIPLSLRIEEFLAAKKEWESVRQEYFKARIIFRAVDQLRKLEEEGPAAITLPRMS